MLHLSKTSTAKSHTNHIHGTEVISRIVNLKNQENQVFLDKFSLQNILTSIEKQQIEIIESFSRYKKEGFNLLEFVRFFLNILSHKPIETLYIVIGLIDLFKEISNNSHKDLITSRDITTYMCDKILKNDHISLNKIQAKYIPYANFVQPNNQIKSFLQNPPIIYGENDHHLHKLNQKSIKTDSNKHSHAIVMSQFCNQLKKIFILDALSESISVYDEHCQLHKKISPVLSKLKKEVIILSFALSKRQYRIGAVLKNFTLKFWDQFNNFDYEKSISTTSHCQNLQSNIYFLEYFNEWITSDRTGTIFYWDLLNEKPHRKLKCKYNSSINDICQISSLNLLVVVQERRRSSKIFNENHATEKSLGNRRHSGFFQTNVVLYNFFTGHIITQIELHNERIPHSVRYSETYQALFMSGLEKKIKVYELHPIYMDSSLKGQLIGHENLITCFELISHTPMLISADDKGKVKLWDYRNFICLQTIDFSDKTIITNLLDMIQIGKFAILGSRVNFIEFQDKYDLLKNIHTHSQNTSPIEWLDFDLNSLELLVFKNKSLRVIDLHNGKLKHIYSFIEKPIKSNEIHTSKNSNDKIKGGQQQQNWKMQNSYVDYTYFKHFSCLGKFILGKTTGEISLYNSSNGEYLNSLESQHEGSVHFVEYDELNKLFITMGEDCKIIIHREDNGMMLKEIKNIFQNKQEIICLEVSIYHNLIVFAGSNNTIFIFNYEFCKIMGEIQLSNHATPTSIHLLNGYSLLLVSTNIGQLYIFQINLVSNLEIQIIEVSYTPSFPTQTFQSNSQKLQVIHSNQDEPQKEYQRPSSKQYDEEPNHHINPTNTLVIQKITSELKLNATTKNNTTCSQCTVFMAFNNGSIGEVSLIELLHNKHPALKDRNVEIAFRPHCKEKNNYNAVRECKQNFANEVQKHKHHVYQVNHMNNMNTTTQISHTQMNLSAQVNQLQKSQRKFNQDKKKSIAMLDFSTTFQQNQAQTHVDLITSAIQYFHTQFTNLDIFKIIQLGASYKLAVGNQRRVKIWNQQNVLLCDFNVNHSLPYLWNLEPKIVGLMNDKIYCAIKIVENILNKFEHDISTSESNKIEIKTLLEFVQKHQKQQYFQPPHWHHHKFKMITEINDDIADQRAEFQRERQKSIYKKQTLQKKSVLLLQNQYSRKDLHYQLVKKFNFTEIAGPSLKELDHIKKVQSLQKEWKAKEIKEQQEKTQLMKTIQYKAQKNEEKDQVQLLLSIKNKKSLQKKKDSFLNEKEEKQHEKVEILNKKLNYLQNKFDQSNTNANTNGKQDHQRHARFTNTMFKTNKNYFNSSTKSNKLLFSESESAITISKTKTYLFDNSSEKIPHLKKAQSKQSFEDYYQLKHGVSCETKDDMSATYTNLSSSNQNNPKEKYKFRNILTEMSGRVNNLKKHRIQKKDE